MTVRPAPYPADTRARGWRFELDYEAIEQSDTWALAAEIPMAQPALLMMWLVSWAREPCGTLPADENVIRAKCRIPVAMWPKLRAVLMRGWWQADDGLLYHDTLTKRVQEMLDYRRKNAERVAKFKAAKREQQAGNALPTSEQHVKNDTGTGTGTINNPPTPRKRGDEGRFTEFWETWPPSERKQDRKKCLARWVRGKLDAEADAILAHVIASKQTRKWRDGFEPAPLTYLNGERWKDGEQQATEAQQENWV